MSESSAMPPAARRSRRRRVIICASFVVLVLLLLAATAAIVLLAVLRPRDPTTELLSANATGAAPRVTFPTVSVQLNVTFLLVVRVRNPNPASFRYGEAATTLLYRGAPVGSAVVPAGTVPSRGATTMRLDMTVQADKVVAASGIGGLLGDVLAGEIEFEARTDVKGRVTFLGFVKRSAQAKTVCRIAIGVPDVKVRRQDCHNEARL